MSGYLQFGAKHPALSKIAEALNEAGDAFHNTSQWQDREDCFDGKSACDVVQAAFDAADEELAEVQAEIAGGAHDSANYPDSASQEHQPGFSPPFDGESDSAYESRMIAAKMARHPEDSCQECGRPNVVWFAPNEIWNTTDTGHGILCPVCFIQRAEAAGFNKNAWRIAPECFDEPVGMAALLEISEKLNREDDASKERSSEGLALSRVRGNHCLACAENPDAICPRCDPQGSAPKMDVPAEKPSYTVERLVAWLDQKYKRHGEECDRQAAAMLLHLQELLGEALPYVEEPRVGPQVARISCAERIQRQVRIEPSGVARLEPKP